MVPHGRGPAGASGDRAPTSARRSFAVSAAGRLISRNLITPAQVRGARYSGPRPSANVVILAPEELKTKLDGGEEMIVVDVRDRIDFDAEPAIIPGALHLTTEELEARHLEIPREREIVLYCTCPSEETSARAALLLRRRGIERIRPRDGGYHGWRDRGYPMTELTIATNGGTNA
jgi:rhodanese-related sulfurtransferase